jgi:prepilin-type N-terminal cleavage/methylation domain-containing protein
MTAQACLTPAINRHRGFTLVESLLAAVVLAILVLGVAGELAASYQQATNLAQTATAADLARQLMEEIASQPVSTPLGTAATVARSQFTGAGQYNLYTDNGSSLTTLAGTTVNATSGQSFQRSVKVATGALPSSDTASPAGDFEVATVTVTTPTGQTITLRRVLTNYTFTR